MTAPAPTPASERERGAILVLTAALLVGLLAFTSIAIDLGYQRVARRDMQALADVVALDMVRMVDGRTVGVIEADPDWDATLIAATGRNDDTQGDPPEVTVELGTVHPTTRAFTASASDADVPNAVRVKADTSVDRFFRPGRGTVSRTAVAGGDERIACFTLGSYAIEAKSGNSALLNQLIGDALNLGVLGYNGLVDSRLTIQQLRDAYVELGFGTANELLTGEVSMRNFVLAVARALERKGDTADLALLRNQIAANIGSLPPIHLSDILNIEPTDDAALSTEFDVFDLVAGAAFVSNGTNLLAVPSLTLSAGQLINTQSSLSVIERPRRACGRPVPTTRAETSQVSLSLGGNVVNLNLGILTARIALDNPATGGLDGVTLATAAGSGTLTDVLCANPEGIDVQVLSMLLRLRVNLSVTLSVTLPLLGSGDILTVHVGGDTDPPPLDTSVHTSLAQIRIPPMAYGQVFETGSGNVGLSNLTLSTTFTGGVAVLLNAVLGILGLTVDQLVGRVVADLVRPLLTNLDSLLVGPLTRALGLNVAGADVVAVPEVRCVGGLRLVG